MKSQTWLAAWSGCAGRPMCWYTYRTESPLHSEFVGRPTATLEKRRLINTRTFIEAPVDRDDIVDNTTVLCGPGGVRGI